MPTYEYVCEACKHEFEEFQSMSAPVMKKCPACKKLKLRRKIGIGAGIIFKGGGFYETDYRSDSYKEAAKRDSGTPADTTAPAKSDAPAKSESGKSESGKSESNKSDSGKSESTPAPKASESKPAAPAKSEKPAKNKESKSKD